ncbi:unnamed protein product [Clonostachys rhizophaga]|uniref:Phosphatidic acid phosphatase type 2/haloperoxidase domain-containing protein n=1 Tax=Clonostachys rhizophaga TaxID=160324 RepID=A0A9N9VAK1_9HYPO|nr:unnamed protein product [Clonostachys rhizophaga]
MDELPESAATRPKKVIPFIWTENLNTTFLSHFSPRFPTNRHRSRSRAKWNSSDISNLQRSFNLWDGIRALQKRRWQKTDLQYAVLAFLLLFSLSIAPSAPGLKTFAVIGGLWLLLMPATRQFFLPSLPIWVWLVYFFCSRFIPYDYRPHIWVRVLPALENVLYGANLSNILSAHQHAVLDILAWIPYGLIHFGAPVFTSLVMFIFAAPGSTPVFARTFGWMSVLGVTIQLVFPCTPPWYENERGLVPAQYGMPGSPAGLARVDAIFGIDLYTTNFSSAPVPFGAFPSLHAANAVLVALFLTHCFPQFRTALIIYAGWVWWATMYLSHHYAVDLVAGGLIASLFFYTARARWLPRRQPENFTRWDYEYVEYGTSHKLEDEERGLYYSAGLLARSRSTSSDGWTLGSSSSWSSGSGTLSPTTPESGGFFLEDGTSNKWNGSIAAREIELSEVVVTR